MICRELYFHKEHYIRQFVTLSNYTKNAQKYLESTPIIRGINGTELVELILKYYDELNEKYRKMVPLKKVYIPVAKEDAEQKDYLRCHLYYE